MRTPALGDQYRLPSTRLVEVIDLSPGVAHCIYLDGAGKRTPLQVMLSIAFLAKHAWRLW